MKKTTLLLALILAGCSGRFTGSGLAHEAERAVAARLATSGTLSFEDVRTVTDTDQACGHVVVRDTRGGTVNEQDFVYADRRVLFDNDGDYAMAAVSCDEADADGQNASAT